jgi:ribosomal protein S18 acetylase RimI-like enzyme
MDVRAALAPGDLGAIVELHGRLYAAEHGLDDRFEAGLARGLGQMVLDGFPRAHEGAWMVDDGGRVRGSLLLSDEGDGLGRVRCFVLEPETRGQGLGRRMLDALLAHARSGPYDRLELVTFSALRAAAHLYRSAGFAVVEVERHDRWGAPIDMQRYELAL